MSPVIAVIIPVIIELNSCITVDDISDTVACVKEDCAGRSDELMSNVLVAGVGLCMLNIVELPMPRSDVLVSSSELVGEDMV